MAGVEIVANHPARTNCLLQRCQAVVSTLNDFFLYKLARTYFDRKAAKWALLCTIFSWFLFYVMVRPFSNTIETLFTTAALGYWPWKFQVRLSRRIATPIAGSLPPQ